MTRNLAIRRVPWLNKGSYKSMSVEVNFIRTILEMMNNNIGAATKYESLVFEQHAEESASFNRLLHSEVEDGNMEPCTSMIDRPVIFKPSMGFRTKPETTDSLSPLPINQDIIIKQFTNPMMT